MDFIKEFGQIGKDDAATAGGKGASLGEMTQADIPVPPGFVILSNAFERFLEETDLNAEIDTVLHTVDQREMHTVENASAKIQALILNAKMPEDIATTIRDFYTRLDTQFVAVRSSATAEDSANAAWAGQLDSFLNTTEETLLTNVQKCWASLFTPRAIFYRYEKELHKQKISVAVVVQKMVQSEVSGIAFSVHPVTEDYNQLIIEAGFGLGEAIVSGSVTPDSYVIEKDPRRIIDKNVTYQSRALWRAENGGNEWRELSQVEGTKPALSDEQALALAEIILRIESHYGFPCDIEWAFEAGTFYITQSRPITTLRQKAEGDSPTIMINTQSREHSLTYCHVWQTANQTQTEGLFESVKNILFVNNGANKKTRVWYGKKELEDIFMSAGLRAESEDGFFQRISKEFVSRTNELVPYCEGKKKIESLKELERFYDKWIEWWAPMAVIFVLPESTTASEAIREKALTLRKETEKYSDSGDRIVMDYVRAHHPQYADLAEVMTPDEILHIKDLTPEQVETIEGRRNGYIFFNGKVYPRNELDTLTTEHNLLLEEPSVESTSEIKGVSASTGRTTGSVVIIHGKKDLECVVSGSVLVTEMTSPDYVPAMKKASAFITNEGGVNCHAAIVARELKKPCVIGTKFATQVLHDGDLVEVDADNGVVRIVERAGEEGTVPDRGNFDFTFESQGTSFIFESLVNEFYDPPGTIVISSGTGKKVWTSLETLADMNKRGLAMSEDELRSAGYRIGEIIVQMKRETSDFAAKEEFTREDAEHMFSMLKKFCEEYFLFDVSVWNGVFEISNADAEAAEKVALVEKSKNKLRGDVDPIFFARDGYLSTLLKKMSEYSDVPVEDLAHYRYNEVLALFNDKRVSETEIEERKKGFVYYKSERGGQFFSGEAAARFAAAFLAKEEKSLDDTVLHGQTANGRGKIQGNVKIIVRDYGNAEETRKKMSAVQEGDILVSTTTDPELVPAMKKAGAIVTDIGGFLSHAAITARELGKICIIGTKVATQVLHDGDLVEVDADNGVVRILKPENPLGHLKEWQRLFRVQGLRFLVDDIWMDHYKTLDALTVIIDDEFTSYLPHKIMERTLADGANLISNSEQFEQYETEFRAYMKGMLSYAESLSFENASREEVGRILNESARLFHYYSKTEFFYTDGAYRLYEKTKDAGIGKRLERMGQIKNDGRNFLNRIFFGADSILSKLLKSFEQRFGVLERILQQYSREELLGLFEGQRVPDEEIARRNDAFYVLRKEGSAIIKSGTDARRDIQECMGETEREHNMTITGTSAHSGIVQGTARIIRSGYDNFDTLHHLIDAMHKGDILVAETTSPELMPACQKAGGIITDQGGMLSHAAIVSRELHIPCIVGTDDATEIIKDGDLVEIDADAGLVRILKRGE